MFGATARAGSTQFRVWACGHRAVDVILERPDGTREEHALAPEGEEGVFAGVVDGVGAGDRYRYRLDGDSAFPDPASRFQPEGVHGPSEIVDPETFCWTDAGW